MNFSHKYEWARERGIFFTYTRQLSIDLNDSLLTPVFRRRMYIKTCGNSEYFWWCWKKWRTNIFLRSVRNSPSEGVSLTIALVLPRANNIIMSVVLFQSQDGSVEFSQFMIFPSKENKKLSSIWLDTHYRLWKYHSDIIWCTVYCVR